MSHQTILERIRAANDALWIGPPDRILWVLSMSYHFTVSIVCYLSHGASIILPANHWGEGIAAAIQRHRATLTYASPIHYALLSAVPGRVELDTVRCALSTTTALEARTAEAFLQRFAIPIAQALGIIEVGLPCVNLEFAAEKFDSVGAVLPAYQTRLDDAGLGPERKEVLFRGPGLVDAYYDPWQPRSQILADGWFRTGDVGYLDTDGCMFLRGRVTDVIHVMGMKVFPQEVEAVLTSHPLVSSACVYGHHDQRLGQIPYARVVPRPGATESLTPSQLREYCRSRLALYEVPEQIEFVERLPQTASGKVRHRE